ncbi:hypothetical protein BDQ17DRAFT_1253482 [Cyathus striatus]|nr:hypothetical protein BDQ17DRAFT_1253482 [Cyathus striatus]
MDRYNERPYYSYSWHQSHDQATVLLMVPYNTQEDDLSVVIERNYLIVGVKNQSAVVKGRLYSTVDTINSVWQLEPRSSRLSARERTTSTVSTASTQSSYAFVSDPDISSSLAASLESGQVSDAEDPASPSPALSSPTLSSADVAPHNATHHRRKLNSSLSASRSVSPGHHQLHNISSYSSLESLHSPHSGGRLLTLHLEKEQSIIWPSLIVGPIPDNVSPIMTNTVVFDASYEMEHQYNMDPTSLALIALELFDIRREKEEAFEYFLRAWHQAHVPSATMRLATHYLPLQTICELATQAEDEIVRSTPAYYYQCIGGARGLAQLYVEVGLLHLDGAASTLLSSSYSSLSSIRMPLQSQVGPSGAEAWKRDREAAGRYFERARILQPDLDIPVLPSGTETLPQDVELQMPSIDIDTSVPESVSSESLQTDPEIPTVRRRKKKEELTLVEDRKPSDLEDVDNTWYLYIPGLVGAGTALLVVGIVGALSFSTWSRRNQGS